MLEMQGAFNIQLWQGGVSDTTASIVVLPNPSWSKAICAIFVGIGKPGLLTNIDVKSARTVQLHCSFNNVEL